MKSVFFFYFFQKSTWLFWFFILYYIYSWLGKQLSRPIITGFFNIKKNTIELTKETIVNSIRF